MTEKRYKSIGTNLECSNGMEYMLIKRNDGFNVCQVCSKYTAKEIVDELNSLADENEQLKAQLYCDSEEGVCSICKHHYVEKTNMFYISKCEKGHEECSTDALKHCKDFELKELQE